MNYLLQVSVTCFENNNDAFIPETWANEGLAILTENMVMANLVHRDFSMDVANFGDVVNTRRPGTFQFRRKEDADSVLPQDASATNVTVPLNQHIYNTFTIKDGESSKSFQDLITTYIQPSMLQIGRGVDRVLCGQIHRFLANKVGRLGKLTAANARDYALEARKVLNKNLAYDQDRRLVLNSDSESAMLNTDLFLKANERGDGGQALRAGVLGRILGFDTYLAQNQPGVTLGGDVIAGAANGAIAAGATVIPTVAALTGAVNGDYVVLDDDGQPQYITSNADLSNVVIDSALKYGGVNADVVSVYKSCNVDGGHLATYAKGITLDGYTATCEPQVGQLLAFGATAGTRHVYTIVEAYENPSNASQTIVWLDRPLDVGIADNESAHPGPYGAINFAFHRDALALVTRPLALPQAGNVRSAIANYNDIAMRVTMAYDIWTQGTVVTMDILAGVALLDVNLGCALLG